MLYSKDGPRPLFSLGLGWVFEILAIVRFGGARLVAGLSFGGLN